MEPNITKSSAATVLGSITTPAKAKAARTNGAKGGRPVVKGRYSPTLHRDGTVTYWSVHTQAWTRATAVPENELAAQGAVDRARILKHLARE